MKKQALALFLSLSTLFVAAKTSSALAPFKKAFDVQYVKSSDSDEFKADFKKLSCNTCHVKGKKKDWLNAYGKELAGLIPGNAKQRLDDGKAKGPDAKKAENAKLVQELKDAFPKVEEKKSPSGVTFGELFESHQLPTKEGAGSVK